MRIINKIWSPQSILNNRYTNSLVRQAIDQPRSKLQFKEELLDQQTSTQRTSHLRQKIGLTLGLACPGLHGRIIKGFSTVENLKEETSVKRPEVLKTIEIVSEAKATFSPKEQMLNDIESFIDEDIAKLFENVFNKFEQDTIKSWDCDSNGNFKLELKAPMRLWTPSKDENGTQNPKNGSVVAFGLDDTGSEVKTVTGKLDRQTHNIQFSSGAVVFIKPDNTSAKPGFSNLTSIRYNKNLDDINLVTKKDLKKDYSGLMLSIVASFAKKYGTVDSNYILKVEKNRTLKNIQQNWNAEAKAVINERTAVGA